MEVHTYLYKSFLFIEIEAIMRDDKLMLDNFHIFLLTFFFVIIIKKYTRQPNINQKIIIIKKIMMHIKKKVSSAIK